MRLKPHLANADIAELAQQCRFADCAHVHEPGCAVKAALARAEIDHDRYRHYVRLAQSAKRQRTGDGGRR